EVVNMSKCAKCNSTSFKIQEKEPTGSRFKLLFVQCSMCGVPIGVVEYHNTGSLIQNLEKKINQLESSISDVQHNIHAITRLLRK
ncbi:MAG: hypothetical protein Q8O75_02740, partial [bacterium]|nr:hypothetical protein [bacterium]